tara:strand:- start:2225 stop:2887 length:663 start_codon:yes stop_codon:yes gene_type:complete
MAKEKASVPFDFAGLMATMGDRTQQGLYGMFPQTAARYSGAPAIASRSLNVSPFAVSPTQLAKGAQGVALMGTRRLPLVAGGLQFLGGDPIGGVGTAAGGFGGALAGAKAGAFLGPKGAIIGGLIGGTLGSNIGQGLTRSVTGIDVNNPLTGPDISLAGIPLTPYAKTKKGVKRAAELEAMRYKELLPIMEKARQQQFQRDLIGSQVQMAGQLLGNIYPR